MDAAINSIHATSTGSAVTYSNLKGASAQLVSSDKEWLTYEFSGPTNSSTKFVRKYRRHSTLAIAQIPLLVGMIGMLPAEAFDALFEENTIELMLNPDGLIWQEKLGEGMRPVCYMSDQFAWEFVRKSAGILNKIISDESPLLEGCLPLDDSRIACVVSPVTSQPAFAIRKRAVKAFTLDEYVESGVLSPCYCQVLREAISLRKNIVILGGTGSGKTTFANAVMNEITAIQPYARLIIIEDTAELNSTALNKVNLQITQYATMSDLVRTSLRLRPDRIIVGEVRGGEAWELLQIWNTGHPGGIATLHANDCASGLFRLKDLVGQHPKAPLHIEPSIALGVNLLVSVTRSGAERRIAEIAEVRDYDPNRTENGGFRLASL